MINTKNLIIGMVIKNYKEMCLLLNEKVKTGGAKQNQLEEWKEYFKYSKQGNKFIIEEIYAINKNIINATSVNKYSDLIQLLIMDLLAQNVNSKNKLEIFLGINKLLQDLCMVNANYGYCRENSLKLASFMDIEIDFVSEFYEYNHKNLKRNLETALNQLQKKSLIFWTKEKAIMKEMPNIIINELNEIQLNYIDADDYNFRTGEKTNRVDYNINLNHRLATSEEIEIILRTEKQVMKDMGFKNKQIIFLSGQYKTFTKKVNKILHEKANILFAYDAYKIICNREYILEEYEDMKLMLMTEFERDTSQFALNESISKNILINAEKRQEKLIESWGSPTNSKGKAQIDKEYIKNNNKLVNTLINKEADYIIPMVKDTKLKKDNYIKDTDDNIDTVDFDQLLK